jgi:predicted RNA binding protein YcfA (HicA-like mRNA interferase family)
MAGLPTINGTDAMKAFQRCGWQVARQRGSHVIMVREGSQATLSVPNHKPLAKGTLRSLIRDADMTVEEFCDLL